MMMLPQKKPGPSQGTPTGTLDWTSDMRLGARSRWRLKEGGGKDGVLIRHAIRSTEHEEEEQDIVTTIPPRSLWISKLVLLFDQTRK